MKITTVARCAYVSAALGLFLLSLLLSGCSAEDRKPDKPPKESPKAAFPAKIPVKPQPPTTAKVPKPRPADEQLTEDIEEAAEKQRDLGPPLADHPDKLVRLAPKQPVWVDPVNKHVVLQGEVCRAGYPLEFFATYANRAYEAVVAVNVTPEIVHAGLLSVGAKPGHPARFEPEFVPPTGAEIAIDVRWKDRDGKVQTTPAQNWIRNIKTKKALDSNWVFAGSILFKDEKTGREYYQANSGELICVLSLPTAMLDLPILSHGAIESRLFEAFEEHLPPSGTPVTILLKPVLASKPVAPESPAQAERRTEAERLAVDAAQAWLALLDRGEYSQCWETASGQFKNAVERRDLVKSLNAARKPLGALKSRELKSKTYATTLPGAPDGQYVVLKYESSFANKKTAVETITPMLDNDKKWSVSGYWIQ